MTAFLIISLVLCGLLALLDLVIVIALDSDAVGLLNLLALIPTIVALSIVLSSR